MVWFPLTIPLALYTFPRGSHSFTNAVWAGCILLGISLTMVLGVMLWAYYYPNAFIEFYNKIHPQ